jgi:hypothetical protein
MNDISRRMVLTGLGVSFVGLLAACTAEAPPVTGFTPSPSPTPSGSGTATGAAPSPTTAPPGTEGPVATAAPRTAVPSFGPNGTHYPERLPWLGDSAATELEVDCSWDAIASAVGSLSATQVAAGAVIRVRPGSIKGRGFGSSRDPVLGGLGDPNWSRNVLICPRDGYGSVVVTDGARIDKCQKLSIFGISGPDSGLVLTECSDFQIGWSQWSAMGITRGGARIDLYEVVLGFRRDAEDTFGIRPTDSNRMVDISRFGCAFGPSVKPDGDKAHCDTAQLEGTGNGEFGPFLSYDCVDYGSSNAALLLHASVTRAEFHHSMVLAEKLPWTIYPLKGGDYRGEPNAFAGGCQDVQLYDSVVCGAIGRLGYTRVTNTVLSYEPQDSQMARKEGGWTVDPSVRTWTAEDIRARTGTDYSQKSLAGFWRW